MPIHKEKMCRRCDTIKEAKDFYKRRKGTDLSPYCKTCTVDQSLQRQRRLKKEAINYLGGKCQRCGYDKCQAAFDFHHRDPSEKEFSLAQCNTTGFNEKIKKELDKCELLCANCHREVHWEEKEFINLSPRQPKKIYSCQDCDVEITDTATRCVTCALKAREKTSWPNAQELVKMVDESNYSAVGRLLGVSDNAVRKRIKNHLT